MNVFMDILVEIYIFIREHKASLNEAESMGVHNPTCWTALGYRGEKVTNEWLRLPPSPL